MKIKRYKEGGKTNPTDELYKKRINAARQLLKKSGINSPNLSDAEIEKAAKVKDVWNQAGSQAKQAIKKSNENLSFDTKFFKGGKMMPKAGYGMRIKKKK